MHEQSGFPLDYRTGEYAYLERANTRLVELFVRHVAAKVPAPRVLDVGAGAGANARALKARSSRAEIVAVEPNPNAAALLRLVCDDVFEGTFDEWLLEPVAQPFDAVLLSDVIEHLENPVEFLARLLSHPSTSDALLIVSVPNYAVWYNRALTLAGRFEYAWSGLYDRTHLRFFTRGSIGRLLEHVGLEIVEQAATPSLTQSTAPLLRRFFQAKLRAGAHLALSDSKWFRFYTRFVEPTESRLCAFWPELLAFQIVSVARRPIHGH